MTDEAVEAVLVAHQRHRGGCLCGWSELGRSHPGHQAAMLREAARARERHLAAIHIVGARKLGNRSVLVMLCSGPDCGGAEILARPTAADAGAEADAHIDKMADLTGRGHSETTPAPG